MSIRKGSQLRYMASLDLGLDLDTQLKTIAKANNLTVSAVIRLLLRKALQTSVDGNNVPLNISTVVNPSK